MLVTYSQISMTSYIPLLDIQSSGIIRTLQEATLTCSKDS